MGKIIIIGAGASGLMAAIAARRLGAAVTILEKMEKPGRKILMTGNGRCNFTHRGIQSAAGYYGESPAFAEGLLKRFGCPETLSFFRDLGVLTKARNGYLYPYTDQAATILNALLLEITRLGIVLKCREEVQQVKPQNGGFLVKTAAWQYSCDQVILAAGSTAAPKSGSSGDGYRLAGELGHTLITPLPALVPLKIKEAFAGIASGVRCPAKVELLVDGEVAAGDCGELQWTDYGVSGIVIFQISRVAVRALKDGKQTKIKIDLFPDYSETDFHRMIKEQSAEALLNGFFAKKLQTALIRFCFAKNQTKLTREAFLSLLLTAKNLILTVTGAKDFDAAQVCQGGIDVTEVDADTLASRRHPGLYFAGEVLDIDGICGGYNLQWAWTTGYITGTSAAAAKTDKA